MFEFAPGGHESPLRQRLQARLDLGVGRLEFTTVIDTTNPEADTRTRASSH